jgi:hypothetical protein
MMIDYVASSMSEVEGVVSSIAEGLVLGMLAHAHIVVFLSSHEGGRSEFCAFVRSVTEWLIFGQTTRAPMILLSRLQLDPK